MCGIDAATTHAVCTNGLEIKFYPNLTQDKSLQLFQKPRYVPGNRQQAKIEQKKCCEDGISCGYGCCSGIYGGGGGDSGQDGAIV